MHVIAWSRIRDFYIRHPSAETALRAWFKMMRSGIFETHADLKQAFGAVDKVGEYHVFNIGGNKYRLIAYVRFDWHRCYIKHVLTHVEYDKGAWKQ